MSRSEPMELVNIHIPVITGSSTHDAVIEINPALLEKGFEPSRGDLRSRIDDLLPRS
jgi:hypothetical protein